MNFSTKEELIRRPPLRTHTLHLRPVSAFNAAVHSENVSSLTEPAGKQVSHKPDDLVVIVLLIALLDGRRVSSLSVVSVPPTRVPVLH